VRKETVALLKDMGKKGETYDDVISRLLDKTVRKKQSHVET